MSYFYLTPIIMACLFTLSRIAWSIKYSVLCYYSGCVFWVDNHLCGWNTVVMSCCVEIILGIGLWILCIAVNIILTGNETYATNCMAKMTECIEVGLPGVQLVCIQRWIINMYSLCVVCLQGCILPMRLNYVRFIYISCSSPVPASAVPDNTNHHMHYIFYSTKCATVNTLPFNWYFEDSVLGEGMCLNCLLMLTSFN